MHLTQRQQKIIALLQENGQITVDELSELLFFFLFTIRRELEILQQYELIRRTHGGAVIKTRWDEGVPALIRESQETASKMQIAQAAASYINDGDHLFIDSSSTALLMADFLKDHSQLTVFTNGFQLASQLLHCPKIKTICTGGQLVSASHSFVGAHAQRFFEYYFADKLFFSSNSFSISHGVTDNSETETELKRQMVRHARQVFYLADASKIEHTSTYKICAASDIHMLITNASPDIFRKENTLPFQIHRII